MRFEQHAIKVLEIAHDKSAEKAKLLLVSTVDGYGALTLLDLAMNGQSRAFIGNDTIIRISFGLNHTV